MLNKGVSNRGEKEASTGFRTVSNEVGKFWEMTEAPNQPIKLVTKQVMSFQETNCVNGSLIKCFYH